MSIFLSLLLLTFSYLGFGLFILKFFKFKFTALEKILFALILSISILSMSFVLLAKLISLNSYYLLIPSFILGAIALWHERDIFTQLINKFKDRLWPSIFLLFAILILASGLFFSSFYKDNQLLLRDTYDGSWHVALIKECMKSLPPHHPSNPKIILSNYHYFYDVFLASLGFFSHLPALNLHYQLGQLLVATLLVLSAFCLGRRMHSTKAGLLLVFFTTFVGSFAYLIPLFLPGQAWSESSFWVSQTFATMTNPQLIFSIATLYSLLIFYTKDFFKIEKRHFLIVLLIIPSIGFKSYGWVLMSLLYAMDLLFNFWQRKKLRYIVYGILYLLLALPIVYLMTGFKSGSFFYHPLWFIDTMVEAGDRLNHLKWRFMLDHYLLSNNYPRILILRTVEILIFYIGNLGTRAIFFLYPIWRLVNKKKWKKHQPLLDLLFILFLFSSIFPLLFLQRGTVWNSIQFWYYALIIANILAVMVLMKLTKNWQKWQVCLAIILLVSLSIPTFWQSTAGRWQSHKQVPLEEVELLASLPQDQQILICPDNSIWYNSSLLATLSPAKVYLADPGQVNLLNLETDDFQEFAEIFENQDLARLKNIVDEEKIDYILCVDEKDSSFIRRLNWQEQEFKDWLFFSAENIAK